MNRDNPTWDELCQRLLDPPEDPLHATVTWQDGDGRPLFLLFGHTTWGPGQRPPEVDAGCPGTVEFWRDDRRLRVEVNGQPAFISDGEYTWTFAEDGSVPVEDIVRPYVPKVYNSYASWLMFPPPASRWIDDGVTPDGPVRAVQFCGRPAWTVTVDGTDMWVDRDTRQVLSLGITGSTLRESLVAPEFGVLPDNAMFSWTGPVLDAAEVQRRRIAERARQARSWMRENITADESPLPVTLDLTVTGVPFHDTATGEFRAYGDGFSLQRRRRAVVVEEPTVTDPTVQVLRWSTPTHDWTLTVEDGVTVDRTGMTTLWATLHPDTPVDRFRSSSPGTSAQ